MGDRLTPPTRGIPHATYHSWFINLLNILTHSSYIDRLKQTENCHVSHSTLDRKRVFTCVGAVERVRGPPAAGPDRRGRARLDTAAQPAHAVPMIVVPALATDPAPPELLEQLMLGAANSVGPNPKTSSSYHTVIDYS